jgi:hypothetical protein
VLLIDAFNVVRAQWVLPAHRRGLDVHGLIGLIGRSRFAHRRLRVVVDGRPGPDWLRHGVYDTLVGHAWTRLGRAEVVFSGRQLEADDVIEEILARSKGLAITVVSSDRRLIRAAGQAGADQIGNGSFLRLLNEDLDRASAEAVPAFAAEVPLDRYSVAHWMREFGFAQTEVEPNAQPVQPVQPAPRDAATDAPVARPAMAEPPPTPQASAPTAPKVAERSKPSGPGPQSFGTSLSVNLPAGPPPSVPATRASAALPPTPARVDATPGPAGAFPDPPESLDPLLRDAFEEWYGSLHLGDLDMGKWLDGIQPL